MFEYRLKNSEFNSDFTREVMNAFDVRAYVCQIEFEENIRKTHSTLVHLYDEKGWGVGVARLRLVEIDYEFGPYEPRFVVEVELKKEE